ncbi:GSCOCG00013008001-RA-CDS, partial [Cotesia congregata]
PPSFLLRLFFLYLLINSHHLLISLALFISFFLFSHHSSFAILTVSLYILFASIKSILQLLLLLSFSFDSFSSAFHTSSLFNLHSLLNHSFFVLSACSSLFLWLHYILFPSYRSTLTPFPFPLFFHSIFPI